MAIGGARNEVRAGFTVFGPTPYRSAADSSFPVDGTNPNFFLEDFEDGELNTPGITQRNPFPIFGDSALAVVTAPSASTDSVDGDDGLIDGSGQMGYSLQSTFGLGVPTDPPRISIPIEFDFDATNLGFLPNSFGVVWTDGPAPSSIAVYVTTTSGMSYSSQPIRDIGDMSRTGETAEDFFIGVIAPEGIRSVRVNGSFIGDREGPHSIEIDHLQYGMIVPEPPAIKESISLGALTWLSIFRRFRT